MLLSILSRNKPSTRRIKTQLIKKRSPSQESQPLFASTSSSFNVKDCSLKYSTSIKKADLCTANDKSLVILKVHNGEEYPIPKEK